MMPMKHLTGDRCHKDPRLTLLPGAVSAGTLLVAFSLMAIGFDHFWIAFPLGFGVVLPIAIGLGVSAHRTDRHADGVTDTQPQTARDGETALETLQRRYAQGELSEPEFEQRVERILETEMSDQHHGSTTSTFDRHRGRLFGRRYTDLLRDRWAS